MKRSHYLNQIDSIRSFKAAKDTQELAQAARQDSSAMKTIAVLTMAFLPATFLATLLSMPSLNWDQRKHFVVYWALAIPLTIATFIVWVLVTQRQQVQKWLKQIYVLLPIWVLDFYESLRAKREARRERIEQRRADDHIKRNTAWKLEMMSSDTLVSAT